MTEGERLASIRAALRTISPGRWHQAHDGAGYLVLAESEMAGGRVVLARLGDLASDEERAFLADAPDAVRFLLGLLDRAMATVRALRSAADGGGEPADGQQQDGLGPDDGRWWRGEAASDARWWKQKDYAAQAAMACDTASFQRFLSEVHGLEPPLSAERAAQKVRTLCGVASRREFNGNDRAAGAWRDLAKAFQAWRRQG